MNRDCGAQKLPGASASVLAYWFGSAGDDGAVAARQAHLWWGRDPADDAEIRRRYAPLVAAAGRGDLEAWKASAQGRLALILLMDQFSRSIHRDRPEAFALDNLAQEVCRAGLAVGADRALRAIERVFFYLPLEHAESLALQDESVVRFRTLRETAAPAASAVFDDYLQYALRHRDVIARFGRFPHRNRILGRASTAAELAFLAEPGSSF